MAGRTALLLLALAATHAVALPPDLRYAPTPQDHAELAAMGWPAARDRLDAALRSEYRPGLSASPGSTGASSYAAWLALWKWSELLARTERGEAARHLAGQVVRMPGSDQPVFVPPGHAIPDEAAPLPPSEAANLLDHDGAADKLGELVSQPPPGEDHNIAARVPPSIVAEWMANPALSHLLFSTLDDEDYAPGVLGILAAIATANPHGFARYPALAVALAVVYDQNFPETWPHRQVRRELAPIVRDAPAELFARWVAANEAGVLVEDLRRLKPGQLKFLVDAPLAETEFAWARTNVRIPRSQFEKAFSMVGYAQQRVSEAAYHWTENAYTLANISARGGICVDQAYFAMIAGKARGIPTLFFVGQGADGGHAWFGFLKAGGGWNFDAGRYENQNYAVGTALDPQTWRPISDHQLGELADGFRDTPAYAASRDDLLVAAMFERAGDLAAADRAFQSAIAVCPRHPEAWRARGEFLARTGAPPDERRALHEAAAKALASHRDERVHHQEALAAIARETGKEIDAASIDRAIVSQNRLQRADLSSAAAARHIQRLAETGESQQAVEEFRRMLASLKDTGGGNFFHEVVAPLANMLARHGHTADARTVLDMARRALDPAPDSLLDRAFTAQEQALHNP